MNTSFTEAIYDIFEQISAHNKTVFPDSSATIYLAGGAAVHFYMCKSEYSDTGIGRHPDSGLVEGIVLAL